MAEKKKKKIFEETYFPDRYINRITDINSDFLKKENISGVIIDIDNTVIDVKRNLIDGLIEWKDELSENDIKLVILSNTLDKPKVAKIADLLKVDYFVFGRKPNIGGFMKASNHLDIPPKNLAVIGDQIFTDILGANRAGMLSVLVNPLQEKYDYFFTRWRRPLEERILSKYLTYIKENDKNPKKYLHVLKALDQRIENQQRGNDTSHTTKLHKLVKEMKQEEAKKDNIQTKQEEFKESIKLDKKKTVNKPNISGYRGRRKPILVPIKYNSDYER